LYVSKRELKSKGKRGTRTEIQYNSCNEAPAKFATVPARLQTYFARVRRVRPSLVLHLLNHGWAGGGGGGGPLVAQACARLWELEFALRSAHTFKLFCKGSFQSTFSIWGAFMK
jgi:hypothetical protein